MQGLAHFVEHMVFMGSSAYPVENHYDAFVHSHGGDCNAMTEGEHTVFQFNISKDHFGPGLDIFANCLLNPLLNADAMERELQAIESEFSLALSDDGARLQQLLGMSSSSDHVLRKFSWGNEYSLKTVPEQHKVDAHHMIRRFHATHYTPNRMKLVMVADCSLADLEGHLMSSAFSHALDGSSRIDPALLLPQQEMMLSPFNLPLPVSSFQKLYRVIPTRKTHKLLLSWQLHSSLTSYKSKSVGYLGHLIGHEGEGSLLSELKRLEYSSSVSAGVSEGNMDNNTMFSVFNITVNLSSKGLANWFTVANVVFVYLHSLKEAGPQEWVYEELRQMADLSFTYLEEEEEVLLRD
jgi:nardilysin